jgi:UDP-glucose 4-epimerase
VPVVLITGVSRFLGSRLAAQLAADPSVDRIVGVDTVAPQARELTQLGRTEFVRADIRNPLIATVLAQARVTTVVHAALLSSPRTIGRVAMQEMNVIGTMQLLAACQKSETLERIVLRSTTAVYGSGPRDPAVFTEDTHPGEVPSAGYGKDAVEVESYVRGFARRRPDVDLSVLRLAKIVGPGLDTALTRYLRNPVVPTALGFDPRLQLLHEADAVEVLRLASVSARPGVVNVAADGVVTLSQLIRRAGRFRLPIPSAAVGLVGRVVGNAGAADLSAEEAHYLSFGRVVDTTRLRERFGYVPRLSTLEAVDSYLAGTRSVPHLAGAVLGVVSSAVQAWARPNRSAVDR